MSRVILHLGPRGPEHLAGVQTLHVGSFDDEADVLARMRDEFVPGNGLRMVGRHHEIY